MYKYCFRGGSRIEGVKRLLNGIDWYDYLSTYNAVVKDNMEIVYGKELYEKNHILRSM